MLHVKTLNTNIYARVLFLLFFKARNTKTQFIHFYKIPILAKDIKATMQNSSNVKLTLKTWQYNLYEIATSR